MFKIKEEGESAQVMWDSVLQQARNKTFMFRVRVKVRVGNPAPCNANRPVGRERGGVEGWDENGWGGVWRVSLGAQLWLSWVCGAPIA
jgi:hypothetical protein